MTTYRLGLDMGANSIGWCAVKLDSQSRPIGVLDAGVRILTPNEEAGRDPQSKTSLAANRRAARGARRRRDRFVRRQKRLMNTLQDAGLMPKDRKERKELEKLDPYWLRKAALDEHIEPYELGRALFHLNQRRGFKSNRIADSGNDEKSAIKQGTKKLEAEIEENGARTLGELLADRHKRDKNSSRRGSRTLIQSLTAEEIEHVMDAALRNDLRDVAREAKKSDRKLEEALAAFGKSRNIRRVRTCTIRRALTCTPTPVRFRPTSQGGKNLYDFYPTRALIEAEIDRIWEAQKNHHPELLTDELLQKIKRIVIEQRPLKKPIVGRCTLAPEKEIVSPYGFEIDRGERAPKAHPLFQRFRILQDVCQLRIVRPGRSERHLTIQERNLIAAALMGRSGNTVSFETLRKAIRLPDDARFNYESGRKGLPPDQTAAKLASRKNFGKSWRGFSRERQIEIVERLLVTEDESSLCDWLQREFPLDGETAESISETRLPQGHGRFGRAVLGRLVEIMERESRENVDPETGEIGARPLTYNEAIEHLDLHHSDLRPDKRHARLPYYGKVLARHVISQPTAKEGTQEYIGRVSNPTVHIGLNQLRKIINALVDAYGSPEEIVVELARDLKLNKERKNKIRFGNRKNEEINEKIRRELADLNFTDTYANRMLLRLYRELPPDERVCVYCGTPISKEMLFNGAVEIDHILPHSRTLDDSFMNKVLCTRECNQRKGNRAPAEAWQGGELREIAERAERLFKHKARRFAPDAMERFDKKDADDEDAGFLARYLTDTQHMSRMARTYLEHVCGTVRASPGRLTSMLRAKWGLNSLLPDHNYADVNQPKNRKDHRHHAIDAFVLACTDLGLLNRIARASGRAEEWNLDRLFPKDGFPTPFEGYREDLARRLRTLIVSHKTDHGLPPGAQNDVHVTSGRLLEDTAYGLVDEEVDGKHYNLVTRKPITGLTAGEIERVRDAALRNDLRDVAREAKQSGRKLEEALDAFGKSRNIRRVRVLKTEQSIRIVEHGNGFKKAYTPGDNHRIEIYELPDGKWQGEGVTVYDANRPGFEPEWRKDHPDAKLTMRVHNGDLIEANFGEGRQIYRVCMLDASAKRLKLADHDQAGSLGERHKDKDDPFRYEMKAYSRLKDAQARRVRIDAIGRVTPVKEGP